MEDPTWDWSYSLLSVEDKIQGSPYTRLEELLLKGRVTRGLIDGIATTSLSVFCSSDLVIREDAGHIGSGRRKNGHAEFLMSLPERDFTALIAIACSGRLKAVTLAFPPFRWNRTRLLSVGFDTQIDDDNW